MSIIADRQSILVRLGGLAILAGMGMHIVLNAVIKAFPPDNPTQPEFEAYLAQEQGNWAIVHGFRYLAFTCIVLFAAALFARTCRAGEQKPVGWGVVGLLGAGIFVTNGIITNGVEMLAFMNDGLIAGNQDLFWLLFNLTRVLFTAEVVTWSILILGFSAAGWASRTLPRWLAALGFVNVLAGMLSGVFIVPAYQGSSVTVLLDVASLTGLLWFTAAGVFLLIKGDS